MLVLSRKVGTSIVINGNIKVTITSISGIRVKLGIEAPEDVLIRRDELKPFAQVSTSEEQ
jgi:carbon storage regulator